MYKRQIVTAPLNKEALNIAGYHYPGHTEILAELCRAKEVVMMLIRGNLRVSHVTTHLPLREVFNFIKRERIFRVITITYKALQNLGINRPRLAVAGLNPHAGEGGLLGKEEINEENIGYFYEDFCEDRKIIERIILGSSSKRYYSSSSLKFSDKDILLHQV